MQPLFIALSISLAGLVFSAAAAQLSISPSQSLQRAIDQAQEGDQLRLGPGIYSGNFLVDKPLGITAQDGVVIDAQGQGNAFTLKAANIHIEGLQIKNWGSNLTDLNAGIFVTPQAPHALIKNNQFKGSASAIWVDASANIRIISNRIEGDLSIRSQDRGNGIHLYAVSGARVMGNEVWHTRDGIYIDTSNGNELSRNYLHDLRYGVHYMYSHSNTILSNHTQNTRTGYAFMQSKRLTVKYNRSQNDQNYGMLLNYITDSTFQSNLVTGVQTGRNPHLRVNSRQITGAEGKALFMYNSVFNQIVSNTFEYSDLGIHLTAGSEKNIISGNSFVSNKEQVKYVAHRQQDWSSEGRGNYWSDYLGWDLDNDGIGDTRYEPNDSMDKLLWKYPAAKVLLNSPALETLRWVQRQFPLLKSPGVYDSAPLISAPSVEQSFEFATQPSSLIESEAEVISQL